MSYEESKKMIEAIRNKYRSTADILFKTALQEVIEQGQIRFQDKDLVNEWLTQIEDKHDKADKEGKILFIGRDFEKAILECAADLAHVQTIDILKYLQHEWQFYDMDDIDYNRARDLLISTINFAIEDTEETEFALDHLHDIGFKDEEIEALGFTDLFNYNEEDDE